MNGLADWLINWLYWWCSAYMINALSTSGRLWLDDWADHFEEEQLKASYTGGPL
jgi:hypothetical protein